jgi:phosphoglycolate phosphatase-like HAD superfamily hydrolase
MPETAQKKNKAPLLGGAGGYGEDELQRAGAYRVVQDPADLLRYLDEMGISGMEGGSR